jgi:hypothetical protein
MNDRDSQHILVPFLLLDPRFWPTTVDEEERVSEVFALIKIYQKIWRIKALKPLAKRIPLSLSFFPGPSQTPAATLCASPTLPHHTVHTYFTRRRRQAIQVKYG